MLHSLPCEVTELSEAVKKGDPAVVNKETLQSLHDLVIVVICIAIITKLCVIISLSHMVIYTASYY